MSACYRQPNHLLCAIAAQDLTNATTGSHGEQLDTQKITRQPRAGFYLRPLWPGCERGGTGYGPPQSLPALPLEHASGHTPRRPSLRLQGADGASEHLGQTRCRVGHRPQMHKVRVHTNQPDSWRRQRVGVDFAGCPAAGQSSVPIGQDCAEWKPLT